MENSFQTVNSLANSLIDGPQFHLNGGANNLTGLVRLDFVGNSIVSAQTLD